MNTTPSATGITLFSALAVRKALDDELLDDFTKETGTTVERVFDPTVALLRRIEASEHFDVLVSVAKAFDGLGEAGIVDPASRVLIAQSGVGVAVVPDQEPVPDISTREAFIATLLTARSVAYSRTGASGIYFAELIQRLGIADAVNARATVIEKGFIAEALVDGRADIAVQQMSELLFVPDVSIVGPLPAELQRYTRFAAGLGADAVNNPSARALLDCLSGARAEAAYARTLLEAPTPVDGEVNG